MVRLVERGNAAHSGQRRRIGVRRRREVGGLGKLLHGVERRPRPVRLRTLDRAKARRRHAPFGDEALDPLRVHP
jgi:hypothetical protein